ncbi:uncharacterized protein LOC110679197 isoform X2 [Aedes aegypti]|uniref:Ionotropic glutamate receptor L-glutamate and glycine-binding domain-containing protein n=1 Tax=Aedes aegypti TaxID=7159 RepID=A0A6I8TRD6_AEDAE
MKVWILAIGIVTVVKFSIELGLNLDDSNQLLVSVGKMVCQLLSNASYRTVHFVRDDNDTAFDDLISNIAQKYKGPIELESENYQKDDAVVMMFDSNSLEYMGINDLRRIGLLLVVVNIVSETEILQKVLSSLRTTQIVRLAIISYNSSEKADEVVINMSTFSRYKTRNCENDHSFVSSFLPAAESGSIAINTSIDRPQIDFQGCSMDVGIGVLAPFTVVIEDDGEIKYLGVEIEMTKALAEHFNFRIRYHQPPHGMQWGILNETGSTGLMRMIQNGEVDFAVGSIARSLIRNTLLIGGVGNFYDQLIFAVPPGIPYTPLEMLIMPVTTSCWILIIVACVVASMLFSIVIDEHLYRINFEKQKISFIDVWFILLGGAMTNIPEKVFRRYVLIGWLMVTLVFRSAYQAILFDHLKSGVVFKPILSLEDMFESGLKFHMFNVSQRHFGRHPAIMKRYS